MAAPVRTSKGRGPALAALTSLLVLALGVPAQAAPGARIRVSPQVGPPTTRITVKGQGFGPTEVVDLSFDSSPEGTATTDPAGAFSSSLRVPASALPGGHTVTATGETSGLSAQAPFAVRTDWPMFKFGPDHAGLNPYENVLSQSSVSGLQIKWTFSSPRFFNTDPAVAGGIVYAGAQDALYAIDATTGGQLWTWTDPVAEYIASPAVWHHRVYFGTDRGYVYALDAATGAQAWAASVGGFLTDLTLAGGTVYIGSSTGFVSALDAATGTVRWSTPTNVVSPAPAVAHGVVYVATYSNGFWALDASTGAVLWTGHLGGWSNDSSPTVVNGLVYVGSNDDKLYAFPAKGCGQATCLPVWTATTGDWVQSSPAVAYGMVFVGSDDQNVYAYDAATGALKWVVTTGDQITVEAPGVANGVVYIGSNDHVLRAIDARSGQVLWSYTTGNLIGGGPVVANGWVYAGSFDDHLYAFHLPA